MTYKEEERTVTWGAKTIGWIVKLLPSTLKVNM